MAAVYFASTPAPSLPRFRHRRMKEHKNIVDVFCINDLPGSEGLVMEVAVCDMFIASTGRSNIAFTLAQQIRRADSAAQ